MLKSVIAGVILFLICFFGNGSLGLALSLFYGLSPFAVSLIVTEDLDDFEDWNEEARVFLFSCAALLLFGYLYGGLILLAADFGFSQILRLTKVSESGGEFGFIVICFLSLVGVTQVIRFLRG
jgi:hypothetical protein